MKLKIIGLAVFFGLLISCGSKSAVVVATPKPSVMTAELTSGKAAYENNCANCHKLFEPKAFSKEAWAPILVSMQKKAGLSDAEMAPITNYIYTQL
jgi:cytochrome c5